MPESRLPHTPLCRMMMMMMMTTTTTTTMIVAMLVQVLLLCPKPKVAAIKAAPRLSTDLCVSNSP